MGGTGSGQEGRRQRPGEAGSGSPPGQKEAAAGQQERQSAPEGGPAAGQPVVKEDHQPLDDEDGEDEIGDPAAVEEALHVGFLGLAARASVQRTPQHDTPIGLVDGCNALIRPIGMPGQRRCLGGNSGDRRARCSSAGAPSSLGTLSPPVAKATTMAGIGTGTCSSGVIHRARRDVAGGQGRCWQVPYEVADRVVLADGYDAMAVEASGHNALAEDVLERHGVEPGAVLDSCRLVHVV